MVNHLHVKAEYTADIDGKKKKAFINLLKYYNNGIQSEVLKEDLTGRLE